jgi:4-hydroxybenzoate polyprenyltransferase
VRSAHPEAVLTVTVLAGALAVAAGLGWAALVLAGAVGLGHLALGWSNDLIDLPRDRDRGRTDKPLAAGQIGARPVAIAIGVALLLHLALILLFGVPATLVLLGAESVAFAYNLGLKDLPISVLPYAFSFGLAPAVITLSLSPPRLPAAWAVAAAALLGVAGHLTQVLSDIPTDRSEGIRGLPQLLGSRASSALAAAAMVLAGVCVAVGTGLWVVVALAAVPAAGSLAAAQWGRPQLAFRLTMVAAMAVVVGIVVGGRRLVA